MAEASLQSAPDRPTPDLPPAVNTKPVFCGSGRLLTLTFDLSI